MFSIHQVLPFGISAHVSMILVLVNDIHYSLNDEIKSFHVVFYWNASYMIEGRFLICVCPCVCTNYMFYSSIFFSCFLSDCGLKFSSCPAL